MTAKLENSYLPVNRRVVAKIGFGSVGLIVNGAQRFIDLMKEIFEVKEIRRYDMPDGTIMHAEILIDDSVLMLGDSSDKFPPIPMITHVYVSDVDEIFNRAVKATCDIVERPKVREGDPDRRATFKDFAGNIWSVGTQR